MTETMEKPLEITLDIPKETGSSTSSTKRAWYLTKANYYSDEANKRYFSFSQYKEFLECEAAAMAKLNGEWKPERDSTPLLVGNYLHSYFESKEAHQQFIDEHPEMISTRGATKGQLKKVYQDADDMINALKDSKEFNELYKGRKEVVMQGVIGGEKWIGKLDAIYPSHALILDLKTTQDIYKRYWVDSKGDHGEWGSFIEARNYQLQMAIYQELSFQRWGVKPQPVIVAVSKQPHPDKLGITIGQHQMDVAMQELLEHLPRIADVKAGRVSPHRCERCEYCRATKGLSVVDMDELLE